MIVLALWAGGVSDTVWVGMFLELAHRGGKRGAWCGWRSVMEPCREVSGDRAARVMADAMVLVETPEPSFDRASGWVAAVYFLEEIFRQSGGVP